MINALSVNPKLCQACGACVEECTHHLVVSGGRHVDHKNPECELCLHCYAVCPAGAIKPSESYSPLENEKGWQDISTEALESLLAFRRSTRNFQPKPVPKELIERVVAAGRYIPSGGNRHAYEFTVLTDPVVKKKLLDEFSQYYGFIRKLIKSPIIKTIGSLFFGPAERAFLTDPDYGQRMKKLLDRFNAGDDPVFYSAPAVIIIHTRELIPTPQEDSLLAGFAMVLVAQTLGLGTCFVSLAHKGLSANKRCKTLVGIDPADYIHAVILLGYPDVVYHRPVPKTAKVVHWV